MEDRLAALQARIERLEAAVFGRARGTPEDAITLGQAAHRSGLSLATLRRRCLDGSLRAWKAANGRWLVDPSSVSGETLEVSRAVVVVEEMKNRAEGL